MPRLNSSRMGRLLAPLGLLGLLGACSAMVSATLSDKPSESMGSGGSGTGAGSTGGGGTGAGSTGGGGATSSGSGGGGAAGPQVACGTAGPCQAPEFCCLPAGGGAAFCATDCPNGAPLLCDSQQDCEVPKICCANMTLEFNPLHIVLVSISCEATCGTLDGAKVCSAQQDCTQGTCSPIPELPSGYKLCKTW